MHDLKSLLDKSIKKAGIVRQVEANLIVEEAREVIGNIISPELAGKIEPLYVKNRSLTVRSSSSIAKQELKFKEEELIHRLNDKFNEKLITKVKYTA
jgi:hypothetical protein